MIRTEIVARPIDPASLLAAVAHESCGASSLFLGTVRDTNDGRAVTGIEYSAYAVMAARELASIADEAVQQFPGLRLVAEHRTGALALGDVSVGIAAAHAHRGPALDATRFVIEALKRRVPVWKREHYADGTREWVQPGAPRAGAGVP